MNLNLLGDQVFNKLTNGIAVLFSKGEEKTDGFNYCFKKAE